MTSNGIRPWWLDSIETASGISGSIHPQAEAENANRWPASVPPRLLSTLRVTPSPTSATLNVESQPQAEAKNARWPASAPPDHSQR